MHGIVLVTHIIAVFALCAVLSIEALSLRKLRRAATFEDASPWIEPVPRLRVLAVASVVLIQLSGIDLVRQTSASRYGWAMVAMGGFPLLMAPFGNLTARRMRALRQAFRSQSRNEMEVLQMARSPLLKLSLAMRTAAFLGVFVLVTLRPGLWSGLGLVATFVSIAVIVGSFPWRRSETPSPTSA